MKLSNHSKIGAIAPLFALGLTSHVANAQPTTLTCSSSTVSNCLSVTQDASGYAGITGNAVDRVGVFGSSGSGTGVSGNSSSSYGISGASTSAAGAYGQSSTGFGVYGTSTSNDGVYGNAQGAAGVYGTATTGNGVQGQSSSGYGVYGLSLSTAASVYGQNNSGGPGVTGSSTGFVGVSGGTDTYVGVSGLVTSTTNTTAIGTYGYCQAGRGVYGNSVSGNGVAGNSTTGIGVYGTSTNGNAGNFVNIGNNNGVQGQTAYGGASGVYGINTSGAGYGVAGRITQNANNGGYAIYGDNASTGAGAYAGYFNGRIYITQGAMVNGVCIAGNCSSDERLKKNIQSLNGSLDILTQLRPVTFEWKDMTGRDDRPAGTQTGFIAQEVEKVKPEWVKTDAQGFKTINRDELPMLLVASIKELSANVKALTAQNEELRSRMSSIEMSKQPVSSGFGLFGGVGLLAIGGAFFAVRKRSSE
jgi:hypothetical protein